MFGAKVFCVGWCNATMAAVWHRLTAEGAEAGLVAAVVLAVRQWWLEDRWLVLVCWQCVNLLVAHHK